MKSLRKNYLETISVTAIFAALLFAILGLSTFPLLAAAALPWLLFGVRKVGIGASVSLVAFASLWLLLAVLMLLPITGLPMTGSIIAIWATLGAVGVLVLRRRGHEKAAGNNKSLWLPALLGPLIWTATLVVSNFVAGASRMSWVMMGDSANNVLFAREVIYRSGIAIGSGENPVPLPAALLALGMDSGRGSTAAADLLAHDIGGFGVVWAILIAATCYLAGVAAASAISSERRVLVAATSAGVSLLPLTWFVTGYPLEFGFFSMHLALCLVLLSWIAALSAARTPVISLVSMFVASTLFLAVWSPLVLIPVGLGVYVVLAQWRRLLAVRGLPLAVVIASFLQLVLYAIIVTLPSLLAQASFLSGGGGIFGFSKWLIIAVIVVGFLAAIVSLRRLPHVAWALAALLLAGLAGLGALLFVSRNEPTPWTYYPVKFAWIFGVIGLVLILGVAAALVGKFLRSRVVAGVALILLGAAAIVSVNWAPTAVPSYPWMNPIDRILSGAFLGGEGDRLAQQIFSLANPEKPAVLWESGDPNEGAINFWLLQMAADSTTENHQLRVYAYGYYDQESVDDLCAIAKLVDGSITVHTSNAGLSDDLAEDCSQFNGKVELGTAR